MAKEGNCVRQCDICQKFYFEERVTKMERTDRPFPAKISVCDVCIKSLDKGIMPVPRVSIPTPRRRELPGYFQPDQRRGRF